MKPVRIGPSLRSDEKLWRYMSIDKFICMLHKQELHFTPLHQFSNTDPFEGLIPKIGLEALIEISVSGKEDLIKTIEDLIEKFPAAKNSPDIIKIQNELADRRNHAIRSIKQIISTTTVNCWHCNPIESEAMWGLYSKQGIAIQTTVNYLSEAINKKVPNRTIFMGKVKYVDFNAPDIDMSSCFTNDGHALGMIKRASYAHENEVRLMLTRDVHPRDFMKITPEHIKVPIDTKLLIEKVYISPYANEITKSCIHYICEKYEIPIEKIENSQLLDGHNEIFTEK